MKTNFDWSLLVFLICANTILILSIAGLAALFYILTAP